jgi:hypothetical protein
MIIRTSRRKTGVACVYCNTHPSTRKGDHVVPRALFLEPRPSDMVTVPACVACNGQKAQFDLYLRDYLVLHPATSGNRVARGIQRKVAKDGKRNASAFIKDATEDLRIESSYSPGGIYLGDVLTGRVDDRKIRTELVFIVRGLYFKVHNDIIPKSYQFMIDTYDPSGGRVLWEKLGEMHEEKGNFGAGWIGEDVFICRYTLAEEDKFSSFWVLVFYGAVAFGVFSLPPGGVERMLKSRGDIAGAAQIEP